MNLRTALSTRLPLALLLALPATATTIACGDKDVVPDEEADTDTDSDTDSDTDTDTDTDTDSDTDADDAGDDIASAVDAPWISGDAGDYIEMYDAIEDAGDRDFFAITASEGAMYHLAALGYYVYGDSTPDTVLRLYNADGEMIATNDDMPWRFLETDSGLSWQATYDGTYYAEVLEWSDWDEDYEATGGSDYEYVLYGFPLTQFDQEDENNEVETIDEWAAVDGNYTYFAAAWSEYASDFAGDMDSAGDIDLIPISFDFTESEYDFAWYHWSQWPGPESTGAPEWRLWDGEMNLLANSDQPIYDLDRSYAYGSFYNDAAIWMMVETGDYYLEIVDSGDASGNGTGYHGTLSGYIESLAMREDDADNNIVGLGGSLDITDNEGFYYGRFGGNIAGVDDLLDSYRVDAADCGGSLDGQFLNVYLDAESVGSLLDATITVYDADGATVLAEETTNTHDAGADPAVLDLDLTGAAGDVFIVITAEDSSGNEYGNNYFAIATVYAEPSH